MISVVIPTFNRSASLKRCLESLENQSFKDFEVIVIDDGSSDDTKEVFNSFKSKRFSYIYQENAGQSAARNNGVRLAKGEIIAFTDDDCDVGPNWLKAVADSMVGNIKCVKGRTEVMNVSRFTRDMKKHIYASSSAATNNIAYDKKIIMDLGLFDESMRLHEDLDLLWRFRLAGFKRTYNPEMVILHEFEKNMVEFKKVAINRGLGLRRFVKKYLKIKPYVAFMYFGAAMSHLFLPPVTRGLYLKQLRAFYLLKGLLSGSRIFKIH